MLDELRLSATWWNYSATNRNDLRIGDGWNQEDLSIFSVDQLDATHDGGRGVAGFARPYVRAAQGRLVRQAYDTATGVFEADIDVDLTVSSPTEIAVPAAAYNGGAVVEASPPCRIEIVDGVATVSCDCAGPLRITVAPGAQPSERSI